ncbi:DUF6325 family protein [Nocardia sp. NPDC056100]|uniref:DUF6325 family protein n=1 Tax=Nocardia sp. NPDC056100 TaxID=3345712 RepID=UPI0035DD1597
MPESPTQLGPVELVVLTFPHAEIAPSIGTALAAATDAGYATVLDLVYLAKDADGQLTLREFAEPLDDLGLGRLTATRELISNEDLEVVSGAMRPGTSAVVVVYEQTWARALGEAVRADGGEVELHLQVPRDVLAASLAEI